MHRYLDIQDVFAVAVTCRDLYRAFNPSSDTNRHLWQLFCMRDFIAKVSEEVAMQDQASASAAEIVYEIDWAGRYKAWTVKAREAEQRRQNQNMLMLQSQYDAAERAREQRERYQFAPPQFPFPSGPGPAPIFNPHPGFGMDPGPGGMDPLTGLPTNPQLHPGAIRGGGSGVGGGGGIDPLTGLPNDPLAIPGRGGRGRAGRRGRGRGRGRGFPGRHDPDPWGFGDIS